MRIVIFGGRGYLGQEFLKTYPHAETPDVDIADGREVAEALDTYHPDVVINCAGKTGKPNVDWCETHREETLRGNVTGPLVLLDACLQRGMYLVHLSTGCIYSGPPDHAFTEEEELNFTGSYYSFTKGVTDRILRDYPVLQLRLRMPFDGTPGDRNLITKLARYPRVLDYPNSVTSIPDFIRAAKTLITRKRTGTYNVVNPDPLSPYMIMEMYREIVDPAHRFERLTLEDLPSVVCAGRSNCVLSCAKLEREGIVLRNTKEVLREALTEYAAAVLAKEAVTASPKALLHL